MYRCTLFFVPLLFLGGCLCDPQRCHYPNLFQPGHIDDQRYWAERFDPFARSDIGPSIAGDRPSGALDPTPTVQRPGYFKSP